MSHPPPPIPEGARSLPAAVGVDGRARTRRYAVRGLALAGALALTCTFAFVLTLAGGFFGGALLAGVGGLVSFFALMVVNTSSGPRLTPRRVLIDHGHLRLGDPGRSFALADVAQGWWEDPDLVHLALESGEVLVLKVDSPASGELLLRAAGVSAAERVLRVPLVSAASQIPGGSVFGGMVLAVFGSILFMAFVTLAYGVRQMLEAVSLREIGAFSIIVTATSLVAFAVYAVTSALRRREAVVGTDGIAYKRTLRTEFIPYSTLASVLPDTRGVRLVRKDGRRILLATRRFAERPLPLGPQTTPASTPAEAQRRVLVERIGAAMASGGAGTLAQVALDLLDRQGRSREAWREDLGKVLAAEGTYRKAGLSPEDLGAVIEDPGAPAERRVAAAVALSSREGKEARRRVRIAVQACADEDLQAALEAAAEGDIDEAKLTKAVARRA